MLTALPLATVTESLAALAAPWKSFYDDSTPAQTAVVFVHLAALFVGGGLAVALDRDTFRALRGDGAERTRHLDALRRSHRTVVGALALALATGALLFLADVETFATSVVYWTKMALVALLLVNGFVMTRQEARLRAGDATDATRWGGLRTSATLSAFLWLATLLAGVALTNAA